MKVYVWTDQRNPATPRATIQRGECSRGHCRQFALSISNGELGLTVRFESETEFQRFLEEGEVAHEQRDEADGHEATGTTRHE
jgi:hypothetical protein